MTLYKLVCPNGCGHYVESVDPKAVALHKCAKANGKCVDLVRWKEKKR